MRGILLTILSLGAAIVAPAKAQFVSIPDSNAVWVTDHYDGPNFLFGQHLWLEPWNRDTIIAGVSYSVLRDSSMGLVTSRFGGGLHDNGSGQVYYYDPFTSMPHLLYDFDVVVGDTLFSVYPSYDWVVETVDTIALNGTQRKRIGLSPRWAAGSINSYWIQGIGSICGLLSSSTCATVSRVTHLRCMSSNDTIWWDGWWGGGGPGDCLTVGIRDSHMEDRVAWFHPTLVGDVVHLDVPVSLSALFEIIAMDGRVAAAHRVGGPIIPLHGLRPGSYVAQLVDGRGVLRRGRFVKE